MGGPAVTSGWTHLYQVSFFFGYIVSGGLHVLFNWLAPPRGIGKQVDFEFAEEVVESHIHQSDAQANVGKASAEETLSK